MQSQKLADDGIGHRCNKEHAEFEFVCRRVLEPLADPWKRIATEHDCNSEKTANLQQQQSERCQIRQRPLGNYRGQNRQQNQARDIVVYGCGNQNLPGARL